MAFGQWSAQQYVRLLNPWCEWNNSSRNFVLAAALLNNGEKYKAKDLFLKSSNGIFLERFLADRVLTSDDDNDAKALVNYHLKIIQLFELHGARDCAIDVARTALSAADSDDPHIATLHSVMFVHHLALGHFEESYNSLIANPDKERRDDNLRDLVKTLLDNKMLDTLMSFPYVDMMETFTNIVMARARACDSVGNLFYDFLYSFEIKRGNMRLAATAMYEQAYRLGQHNTVESLEQQVKCYLACLNALYLVNDNHRWVIRPVDQGEEEETYIFPPTAGSDEVSIR
ncbi:Nucleoporin 160kD [Carabus blaptoides fortunei]